MGGVISKAANGIGGVLGNAFVAPLKTIFGASCEGVCSGPWDVCYCFSTYCTTRWASVNALEEAFIRCVGRLVRHCFALEDITCFLWHRLKNTKRIIRRRRHHFQNIEIWYSSSDESGFSDNHLHLIVSRKRRSVRERRKDWLQSSLYPSRRHSRRSHQQHHVLLKSREPSIQVKGGSQGSMSSRQLQSSRGRNAQTEAGGFKRRRLR